LDRASDFESAGRPFESGRVRHSFQQLTASTPCDPASLGLNPYLKLSRGIRRSLQLGYYLSFGITGAVPLNFIGCPLLVSQGSPHRSYATFVSIHQRSAGVPESLITKVFDSSVPAQGFSASFSVPKTLRNALPPPCSRTCARKPKSSPDSFRIPSRENSEDPVGHPNDSRR
jgi:hypothetical protein